MVAVLVNLRGHAAHQPAIWNLHMLNLLRSLLTGLVMLPPIELLSLLALRAPHPPSPLQATLRVLHSTTQ